MANERIASAFCFGVAGVLFMALALGTVYRDFRILLTANGISFLYPSPIYGIKPLPVTGRDARSSRIAGADFSQVYTSALALRHGESAYRPRSASFQDRFWRKPGLPPLTNWLYVPLSLLPYGAALVVHTVGSIGMFLGVAVFVLRKAGLARNIAPVCLVILSLYLLTPIGVTHLERGQFDLIVAGSILACVSCLLLRGSHPGLAVGAGFIGAMKWTAAPFLFCFCGVGFLFAGGRRRWAFLLVPAVMLVATFAFGSAVKEYWPTIRTFEFDAKPFGLTLQNFMPRWAARGVLPVISLATAAGIRIAGDSPAARARSFESIGLPFALALESLSICFGTLSYEYHTVTMLGMIPAVVVWTVREPGVSHRWKAVTCGVFGAFLCIAFRAVTPSVFSPVLMTAVYVVSALLFLGVCASIVAARVKSSAEICNDPGPSGSANAAGLP